VGGITDTGHSVRLVAADAVSNERAGLEYQVGEVWDIDSAPDPDLIPPHIENIIVLRARRLRLSRKLKETILRFMPPVAGGPEQLFDGLTQATAAGGLYIAERTGLPKRSTMFWAPDQPLRLDCDGKRLRYRYPTQNGWPHADIRRFSRADSGDSCGRVAARFARPPLAACRSAGGGRPLLCAIVRLVF
jgi:hypothetical protein